MLYQYLLDEVGRKQVKVVKRTEQNNDGEAIALSDLVDRHGTGGGVGWLGSLGLGTGLGAGEPVMGRKSTGLPKDGGVQETSISRSRSERHPGGGGRLQKSRGKLLRRLFLGGEERNAGAAVDEFIDDGSVPTTPQVPAFVARAVDAEELVGRDRLTM